MNLQDLFESQQQCPECGGPAFSDLILAEKKDACYNKVRSRYKVWPSAYASGALVQCRKKGAANWGNKSEGVAEGSEGQKFIVTYNNSLSNDLYTVMVSADDEYDAKDKVRYALGMGDRITDVKSARGNEPTDREYKVFVDPKTSQKRSGIYDRQQGLAEDVELAEEFDLIETIIDRLAEHNGVDAEVIWEDLESLTDDELYVFAVTTPLMEDWQKVNKRDKTDGMSRKAVKAYRRENPGSKLKTAVTTKPSKLKKGGKASKRRKSYCSRSRGQMKMHSISCAKTPDKAICKARRRWNCESIDFNLSEMDKSQTSPGRDGDIDWTKKQIHLGPEHVIKAKDVAQHALKALDKTMKKSHPHTPKKKGVAEAFGPLPQDNQQIRLGRHTVDIERVGLNKNYISFAWHDSKGQEHYEEVAVGDLGSYDDLVDRIKDEIRFQERKYTDQGVAEAGPFSYGKAPRKGSVADLAAKKRREQERGKQLIEPKDQQVGVAKVTKGVAEGSQEDAKFTPRFEVRSRIESALDQYLDPEQVAGGHTDIQYYKHDGRVYVEVLFNYTNGQKIGPTQRKRFLVNKDFTLTPIKRQQGVTEGSLNEFAPDGFNGGGDDSNDLQLYLDVAKKLNMKKYKPSTAHALIAKKMAELVDVVDDDKVDYARHMARKAQGLPNMLEQGVAEGNEEKIGGRYDPEEFDAMIGRLKKLAGAGPLKTVWDPVKRVYKNVPVAQQPKPQPR